MSYLKRILSIIIITPLLLYLTLLFIGKGFDKKKFDDNYLLNNNDVLFFAHRGVCDTVPENSLEAIKLAKNEGFTAVEIDVVATFDKELILFHDLSGKRLFNKNLDVKNTAYPILQKLPLYKDGKATDYTISRLDETLDSFNNSVFFYLDLKNETFSNFKWIVEKIYLILKKKDLFNQVIVASSNTMIIGFIEYYYPQIMTVLEGFDAGKEWTYDITPKLFRPDFVASFNKNITLKHINWLKKRGILNRKIVYGGTMQNYKNLVCSFGIKNIIIDYHPSFKVTNDIETICSD